MSGWSLQQVATDPTAVSQSFCSQTTTTIIRLNFQAAQQGSSPRKLIKREARVKGHLAYAKSPPLLACRCFLIWAFPILVAASCLVCVDDTSPCVCPPLPSLNTLPTQVVGRGLSRRPRAAGLCRPPSASTAT